MCQDLQFSHRSDDISKQSTKQLILKLESVEIQHVGKTNSLKGKGLGKLYWGAFRRVNSQDSFL